MTHHICPRDYTLPTRQPPRRAQANMNERHIPAATQIDLVWCSDSDGEGEVKSPRESCTLPRHLGHVHPAPTKKDTKMRIDYMSKKGHVIPTPVPHGVDASTISPFSSLELALILSHMDITMPTNTRPWLSGRGSEGCWARAHSTMVGVQSPRRNRSRVDNIEALATKACTTVEFAKMLQPVDRAEKDTRDEQSIENRQRVLLTCGWFKMVVRLLLSFSSFARSKSSPEELGLFMCKLLPRPKGLEFKGYMHADLGLFDLHAITAKVTGMHDCVPRLAATIYHLQTSISMVTESHILAVMQLHDFSPSRAVLPPAYTHTEETLERGRLDKNENFTQKSSSSRSTSPCRTPVSRPNTPEFMRDSATTAS
jgi:hypothetical protein